MLPILGLLALGGCPPQTPPDDGTDGQNGLAGCPSAQDTFGVMLPATYAVGFAYPVGNETRFATVGTAFAIDRRLLATNGHVANAILDAGKEQTEITQVYAVQHGTGVVIELLRAIVHPDFTGSPLSSPDVALFTTKEQMPAWLTLAANAEVADIGVGDQLYLTGFPGDVNDFIPLTPGQTVPQATSLAGTLSALRAFDTSVTVTPANADIIQHQLPTSAGTSGSALTRCGVVVAAHNAGTVKLIITVGQDGQLTTSRTSTAANNFGIHVRHLNYLVGLFDDLAIQGEVLPPEFEGQGGDGVAQFAGTYAGSVTTPDHMAHTINFTVAADGALTGTVTWPAGTFTITGQVTAAGALTMTNEFNDEYTGTVAADGSVTGTYTDYSDFEGEQANWTATKQ